MISFIAWGYCERKCPFLERNFSGALFGGNRRCGFDFQFARNDPFLAGLDLQSEVLRIDSALREAAGDEPEAGLAAAFPHIGELAIIGKTPDGAGALCNLVAEEEAHQILLAFIAGRYDEEVGRHRAAVLQSGALGHERIDFVKLQQADLTLDDQFRATDIQVISAAPLQILHLKTGAILADIHLEADRLEFLEQVLVGLLALFDDQLVGTF